MNVGRCAAGRVPYLHVRLVLSVLLCMWLIVGCGGGPIVVLPAVPSTLAGRPGQCDYSVTDIAMANNGRLYFGVWTVTNSGVVGIDNMSWLREYRYLADKPWGDLYLLGRRFDTPNPFAGIFGGTDIA